MGPFFARMAVNHLFLERFDEAVLWGRKSVVQQEATPWISWTYFISALGHSGLLEEAKRAIDSMTKNKPKVTVSFARGNIPALHPAYADILFEGLRKAGLPEG